MKKQNNLKKSLEDFISLNENIAKKYKAKVSIGIPGRMVTIADHRKKK